MELLEKAFKTAGAIERPAAKVQAFSCVAEAWLMAGEKVQAKEMISEAIRGAEFLKHPDEKARMLAWSGRLLHEMGEKSAAQEQFKRAYYLARAAESLVQKIGALYILASEYVDSGLKEEAKVILVELEPVILDPASEIDSIYELINIAEIYIDIDDIAKAMEILGGAVKNIRTLKDRWFKAERLIEIADLYRNTTSLEESVGLIQEALQEIDLIEESGRPYFWLKLAAVYTDMDLKNQAGDCLLKAREAVMKSEDLLSASGDVLQLAKGYIDLGDRLAALDLLDRCQIIISDLPDIQDRIARWLECAEFYRHLNEDIKTLEMAEKIHQMSAGAVDNKARLFTLGKLVVLYACLDRKEMAAAQIDELIAAASEGKTKTSGLGPIARELADAGKINETLKLAEIIREPEVKAAVLIESAKYLINHQTR
jgi:tetratricopeptide (TPR) repeat protein